MNQSASAVDLVPADGRSLEDLAAVIRREHEAVEQAVSEALERALICGQALLDARSRWGRNRGWEKWVLSCGLTAGTAGRYMRLARYREVISTADVQTVSAATALLSDRPRGPRADEVPQAMRDEAIRLVRSEGVRVGDAAKMLGISRGVVQEALEPGYMARAQRRHADRQQLRHQERMREMAKQAKASARKLGGARSEAYAMAERLQDVLARAQDETTNREAREALARAGEHYRKMRDEVVRALGVS